MTRNATIKRGEYRQPEEDSYLYEKTSSDFESVNHLGASKGTGDHQFKIYVSGVPAGVFLTQVKHPGQSGSPLKYNRSYAEDGQPIDIAVEGDFVFEGVLDDGQSITKYQPVQFESGTGKIQKQTSNPRCGWAVETKAASGADSTILVQWDPEHSKITTETVTVTSHAGVLANTPIEIYHVEATTGSALGGKVVIVTDTTPAAGDVYWNGTTGLTFNTTDAVTAAKVRYRYA